MDTTAQVLDRMEAAISELAKATAAVIQLARQQLYDAQARAEDDDDWRRLPMPKKRCIISNWSRSTLNRHIEEGHVRRKRIRRCVFYSGKDVRNYLNTSPSI